MKSFSFRTTMLAEDINPVTPINRERLVPDTNCIILDCTETPTLVTVNGLTVWDGVGQNGWSGYLITNWSEGKRLVLDPPAPFTVGDLKIVEVTAGPYTLAYTWVCGTKQITTTDDASSPRVTEATVAYPYAGYVREFVPADIHRLTPHSDICLRKVDPLTAEVQVVPGYVFDIGYDPTLNQLVVFYVHGGKIFLTLATPGDGPTTLIQADEVVGDPTLVLKVALRNDLSLHAVGAGYMGLLSDPVQPTITPYIPIKMFRPETLDLSSVGSGYSMDLRDSHLNFYLDVLTATVTPFVISTQNVPYDEVGDVVIGVPRVAGDPESALLIGYNIVKLLGGRAHEMGFVAMDPDATYLVFTDTMYNPGAQYAVVPIYRQGKRAALRGAMGPFASQPTYSDILPMAPSAGSGYAALLADPMSPTFVAYPPLKVGMPDSLELMAAGSGYNWHVQAARGTDLIFEVGGLL